MNGRIAFLIVGTLSLLPQAALAHVGLTGLGGFWNGFLHPLLTPSHLMALLAVGMLLGTQPTQRASQGLFAFVIATCIGLAMAGAFGRVMELDTAVLLGAASTGLLVAWQPALPGVLLFILVAACGLLLGNDSAQEAYVGKELVVTLFATGLAVFLAMLYLLAAAEVLQRYRWTSVGVRVLGSWIAASALIVLALSFAPSTV
ncbi:MAG: HupE/UreJ family protein [Gammaproteobacteria bacterium]|nr:HupE/UreJ family protein [Gammaproteobacteria bacterium]